MNVHRSLVIWSALALLLFCVWYFDPYVPTRRPLLAGGMGRPTVLRVQQGSRWVEFRQRKGIWYIHACTRRPDEADDPYRLGSRGASGDTGPSYDGLHGHKDRKRRHIEEINALLADVVVFLYELPCQRDLAVGQFDEKEAGLEKRPLEIRLKTGVQQVETIVLVGDASPTGLGHYVHAPATKRAAIVTPTLKRFATRLLERRFGGFARRGVTNALRGVQ